MGLFTRNTKPVAPVAVVKATKGIELFMADVAAFEEWADDASIANNVVLEAISEAEVQKMYLSLSGMKKRYASAVNDGNYGKRWAN